MTSHFSASFRKLTRRIIVSGPLSSQEKEHILPFAIKSPIMAEAEEDFSSLPLTDRFQHKVSDIPRLIQHSITKANNLFTIQIWKVRKAAYEDAAKQFEITPDEHDPLFRPFIQDSGLWKGAVADSNVAAQQEGIAALCSFLKFGGKEGATK